MVFLFFLLLTCALTQQAIADAIPPTFSNRNISIPVRANEPSSVTTVYPTKISNNGRKICSTKFFNFYPDEYGNCENIYIYHLAQMAVDNNKLSCAYDITKISNRFVFSVHHQSLCPDIIISKSGYRFQQFIFFDFDLYTINKFYPLPKQSFSIPDNLLDNFPRTRKQFATRRKFFNINRK